MTAAELNKPIKASEGRIILAETVVTKAPLGNAEMMRHLVDMLLLTNMTIHQIYPYLPAMDVRPLPISRNYRQAELRNRLTQVLKHWKID